MTKFFISFIIHHDEPRFDVGGIGHTREEAADACARNHDFDGVEGFHKYLEKEEPGRCVWDVIATLEVTERVYRHVEKLGGSADIMLDEDQEPADFFDED